MFVLKLDKVDCVYTSAFFLCAFAALREISYTTDLSMIDGGKQIAELV
jgi:hypothetical protein